MSKVIYDKSTPEYDAANRSGIEILAENSSNRAVLTFVGLGADFSGGTATIHVKSHNSRRYLALKNGAGSAVTVNLATTDSVVIDQPVAAVRVGVSGIAGATGWKAILSGIDEPMGADSLNPGSSVQIVAGQSAVGTAPANPPVGVAGVDGGGLKRALLTDATGKLTTVTPDCADVSGSVSSADVLFTLDLLNYPSASIQIISPGTSCNIVFESSYNGTTDWTLQAGFNTSATSAGSVVQTATTTASSYTFAKRSRYLRARVAVYGSGTVSAVGSAIATQVPVGIGAFCWGPAGEGSPVAAAPVAIAAEARTTRKTSAGNGTVVRPIATSDGRIIMRPHSIPESEWKYAAASGGSLTNSTTSATLSGAAGAGLSVYLTSLQIQSGAITNVTDLVVYDGATGVVIWRCSIPTTGMPLTTITFADPLKGTANTLMGVFTVTAIGTGSIYVNAQGYYAP